MKSLINFALLRMHLVRMESFWLLMKILHCLRISLFQNLHEKTTNK